MDPIIIATLFLIVLGDSGANANVELDDGPVLSHAVIYDQVDYALALIKRGANVNTREPNQVKILHNRIHFVHLP